MAAAKALEASPISSEKQQPHRTKLGMEILSHLNYIETTYNSDFIKKDGRDLTKEEEGLKSATIKCLREYMCGEINLGDCGYSAEPSSDEKKYTKTDILKRLGEDD